MKITRYFILNTAISYLLILLSAVNFEWLISANQSIKNVPFVSILFLFAAFIQLLLVYKLDNFEFMYDRIRKRKERRWNSFVLFNLIATTPWIAAGLIVFMHGNLSPRMFTVAVLVLFHLLYGYLSIRIYYRSYHNGLLGFLDHFFARTNFVCNTSFTFAVLIYLALEVLV